MVWFSILIPIILTVLAVIITFSGILTTLMIPAWIIALGSWGIYLGFKVLETTVNKLLSGDLYSIIIVVIIVLMVWFYIKNRKK